MKKEITSINGKKIVWILGFISLFTDISTEMLIPILPIFLTAILGANMFAVWIIEWIWLLSVAFFKSYFGLMSDKMNERKSLILFWYWISTLAKPLFAFSWVWQSVLWVRFLDRMWKWIRTSPRDALISESVPEKEYGKYFWLHRTLDSIWAIIWVLILIIILYFWWASEQIYRNIFLLSFIPASIAMIIIIFYLKESKKTSQKKIKIQFVKINEIFHWSALSNQTKKYTLLNSIFLIWNFSFIFLLIKAHQLWIAIYLLPVLYLINNIFYAAFSYPVWILSDLIWRKFTLILWYLIMLLVCIWFIFIQKVSLLLWILFWLYGIFLVIYDTISKTYVAELSKNEKLWFHQWTFWMIEWVALLFANLMFGFLWFKFWENIAFTYTLIISIISITIISTTKIWSDDKINFNIKNFRFYRD